MKLIATMHQVTTLNEDEVVVSVYADEEAAGASKPAYVFVSSKKKGANLTAWTVADLVSRIPATITGANGHADVTAADLTLTAVKYARVKAVPVDDTNSIALGTVRYEATLSADEGD